MWPREPDDFLSLPKHHDESPADDSLFFTILDGEILCLSEAGIPRPITADEFRWLDVTVLHRLFMGSWHGKSCYALSVSGSIPSEYAVTGLRSWLGRVEPSLFYLAGRAVQLIEWLNNHAFCGRCGSKTNEDEFDRATSCPDCGLVSYPRISPSIIVLVRKQKQALLARNKAWPNGMYSTLAGFVEPGESIEQTVHREVREEVGIEVTNLRYLGSQSWPFPNSLMLGFHADYHSGEFEYADGEIAEARWFEADDLPNIPGRTAISRWLIDEFVEEIQASSS